jgi:hypothetical protein
MCTYCDDHHYHVHCQVCGDAHVGPSLAETATFVCDPCKAARPRA